MEDVRQLRRAVESLLPSSSAVVAQVQRLRAHHDDAEVARRLVARATRHAAVAGTVAALPGLVPGVGTVAAVAGGAAIDVAALLRVETTLALQLAHLHGFDIDQPRERDMAFALATYTLYETADPAGARAAVGDEVDLIWRYGPRELSKLVLTLLSGVLLGHLGKGAARAIPFVGVVVGATVNASLTDQVGRALRDRLARRQAERALLVHDEEVVDARVVRVPAAVDAVELDGR